jgi:hypothetical protein
MKLRGAVTTSIFLSFSPLLLMMVSTVSGWQMMMPLGVWTSSPPQKFRQRQTSTPTTRRRNLIREQQPAAGAAEETMFSRAKTMRKKQITRIKGAWTKKPASLRLSLRGKHQRVVVGAIIDMEQLDLWGVEKTRQDLSLPSWACESVEEERRLAAMKMLLERELERLNSKMVTLPQNGGRRVVKVVTAFPDVYSDFRLLRFLRKDKIQDPVTAAMRYRQYLQWRERNDIDAIRAMVESHPFEPPPALAVVENYLPCEFRGEPSRDGIVPILLQVGSWDTAGITQLIRNNELPLSAFLQYWAYMFDSLHYHLYQESMKENQMVFIDEVCDLSGMTLQQFSPAFVSTVLKPWMDLTQSNYPETARRILFLRPPRILRLVWTLVTPLASPGTVAKISLKSDFTGSGKDYFHQTYSKLQ